MISQYGNTYFCLSTDAKPLCAQNGRELKEIDTGKTYYFDADSGDWLEWGAAGTTAE